MMQNKKNINLVKKDTQKMLIARTFARQNLQTIKLSSIKSVNDIGLYKDMAIIEIKDLQNKIFFKESEILIKHNKIINKAVLKIENTAIKKEINSHKSVIDKRNQMLLDIKNAKEQEEMVISYYI